MTVNIQITDEGIGVLQVNRPEIYNALNMDAMYDFRNLILDASKNQKISMLIITGVDRAFIAGGDLKDLHTRTSLADAEEITQVMTEALEYLEALPFLTIAAINGPARGGGAEISLACDLRFMDIDADMGFVHINLGLTPGWGAGQRLLRLVGYSRAMELLITGRIVNTSEALQLGLINQVTQPGQVLNTALDFSREVLLKSHPALLAVKRILRAGCILPPATASSFEKAEFPPLWVSQEHTLAVNKFLNRKRNSND